MQIAPAWSECPPQVVCTAAHRYRRHLTLSQSLGGRKARTVLSRNAEAGRAHPAGQSLTPPVGLPSFSYSPPDGAFNKVGITGHVVETQHFVLN